MRSAEALTGLCHDALPVLIAVRCMWIGRVCAGGDSCSNSVGGTTIFVSDRSLLTCWSSLCAGAAQTQRYGHAGSSSSWLTLPRAHKLVLLRQQQPYGRTSRRMLQRLRRVAPGHVPCAQSVSRFVLAVHTYTERCRERPVYGSRERWSGTDFVELFRPPES